MNFPLSTAFTVSHRFWVVVFSFSFVSMHILISFFVPSLSGFGIRVMVASLDEFGSLPPSEIFWNSLNRIGVGTSLNFW